jgi:hypothetical protein
MEVVAQKKSKLKEITISIENQPTLKSTESKKEAIGYGNFEMDNDNISKKEEEKDSSYSENKSIKDDMVENIDVNLQDDYFVPKSKKRAEEEDESEEPVIQKPRQTKITHQKDDIVAKLSLDSIKNPAKLEVQMPKETQVNPLRNSNYNQSNSKPNHNKKSSVDDRKIKPSINIFINNSNINNNNHQVNKSPSPRQNKFKEYDRIIETHLNEIYLQKAKALGDKMKKKLKPQVARNNIHANNKHNITNETNENLTRGNTLKYGNPSNNHNIVAKINLKDINKELIINRQNEVNNNINVNQQGHNKSLSISAVTFNNELNFNSEQDILDNILDFECNKIDKKILKKEDIAIFSDQKIKDYSDVNMISKISNKNTNVSKSPLQAQRNNKKYVNNYLNSANFTQSSTNIKNLTQDNSKQNTNLNTERGNDLSKKITNPVSAFSIKIPQSVVPDNVQKSNEISTNNVDKFLNNNLNNYKGIIKKSEDRRKEDTRENKVKSRDHSPSLNRARFEKNLQKQIVKENKAKVNNNSVSKNAMDFMKEYSNLKLSTNICVKTDYSENKDLYQDKNEKQFKSRSNSKINFANEKKRIEFDKRSLDDLKEFSIDVYNENIFTVKNMMIDNRQNNPNDR